MNSLIHHHINKRIVRLLVIFSTLSFLGCTVPVKPLEPGWVSPTGVGAPTSFKLQTIASTAKQFSFAVKVDGFVQDIKQEESITYQRVKIPNAGVMSEVGKPNLPVIRRLVAVPAGKKVVVSVVSSKQVTRRGYNIYPVQEPVVEQAGGPYRTKFTINRKFYQTNQFYPGKLYSVSKPMIMSGQTVVQIEVFPMQYNPDTKTINLFTDVKLKIDFIDTNMQRQKINQVRQISITTAQWKEYKRFANFDWLKDLLVLRKGANYLIIAADDFVEEIAPLAEWKHMKGFTTKIVKVSTIGNTDTAIRNYISNAYHNWKQPPDYVLLVGDVETIPAHLYNDGSHSCATDLYYATVDGNDFLPDLAIGRFSAKTESEVTGMVNKTINYERTPVVTSAEWYSRVSLVSDSGYFEDTSNWIYSFLSDRGYAVNRFYRSDATATKQNISDAANEGRIILNYRGHGSVDHWVTGNFHNADVLALNNNDMLPIIISPTCQTGWFDDPNTDCYGETWLKAGGEDGHSGAVAFWGSSRNSYGGYNDELAMGVYKAAFDDGLGTFGDITNQAKLYMFNVYGTSSTAQLEFNLFNVLGDPELNVWFQVPLTIPPGWKVIDLDILGSNLTGGVTKEIIQDVGTQNAFPVLSFPYGGSPASFVTFSVPSDWDGISDFMVEFVWYSPTQDGNVKWSIVNDRKDATQTPFHGFNRHIKYSWGARKNRVAHSSIELWALSKNGPRNPGDVITLGLERFRFNSTEAGSEQAITSSIKLISARVLYRTRTP